jgi:hypothetical protein
MSISEQCIACHFILVLYPPMMLPSTTQRRTEAQRRTSRVPLTDVQPEGILQSVSSGTCFTIKMHGNEDA